MKDVLKNNIKTSSFFRGSHYWGGQLTQVATQQGVTTELKGYTDSRWYSLMVLLCSNELYR
jgi:hypothetical protein